MMVLQSIPGAIMDIAPFAAVFAAGALAGALSPSYFAIERLRGMGRYMMSKLPYEPPPGLDTREAMVAAYKAAHDDDTDSPSPSEPDRDDDDARDSNQGESTDGDDFPDPEPA